MKTSWMLGFAVVAGLALFGYVVNATAEVAKQNVPTAPTAKPVVSRERAIFEEGIAGMYLQRAHDAFAKSNWRAASNDLRQAASIMEKEARDVKGLMNEHLMTGAKDIRTLASNIDKGTIRTLPEFDKATVGIHHTLAEFHIAKRNEATKFSHRETLRHSTRAVNRVQRAEATPGMKSPMIKKEPSTSERYSTNKTRKVTGTRVPMLPAERAKPVNLKEKKPEKVSENEYPYYNLWRP